MQKFKSSIVVGQDAFYELKARYVTFFQGLEHANVFFSPDWVYTWYEQFGHKRKPAILLLETDEDDAQIAGIWPFHEVPGVGGPGLWPMSYHTADYFEPLVDERMDGAAEAMVSGLAELLGKYYFIWLPLLRNKYSEAILRPGLVDVKSLSIIRAASQNPYINITDQSFIRYLGSCFSKESQRKLNYSERKLSESGKLRHEIFTDSVDVERFLPQLIKVEESSWKHEARVGLFALRGTQNFYYNLLPRLARSGLLKLSALTLDGEAICYEIGLRHNGYYGMHNIAFHEAHGTYSPGRLLMLRNIKVCFQENYVCYDFMQGNQEYKRILSTHSEALMEVSLFPKSFFGYNNFWAVKLAIAAKNMARKKREKVAQKEKASA